jgi:hypothetical protein
MTKGHIVETPYSILSIALVFKVNESIAYNKFIDGEVERALSGFSFLAAEINMRHICKSTDMHIPSGKAL